MCTDALTVESAEECDVAVVSGSSQVFEFTVFEIYLGSEIAAVKTKAANFAAESDGDETMWTTR